MDSATAASSNVAFYVDARRQPKDRFVMTKERQPSHRLYGPDAAKGAARVCSEFEE
jgi:hypothetical protein